jgi:hypothetical protein
MTPTPMAPSPKYGSMTFSGPTARPMTQKRLSLSGSFVLKNKFDTWHVSRYICRMISSFRHKGLRLFYEKGTAAKLQPQHIPKIRLILTRLDAATSPNDLNVPGYSLHPLLDVDYLDYH